ncbi:hypothetical protein A2160_05930 [Candidatus Beckwithbacteria bacterium RBG_13_42_9]|uniref:Tyrosine recombinase XerC n=1 Tax=Candidatus Beckwithbacteria bacterium RBG_13_42_9 TaxID=1797457 RepID=A0A1F5E5G9_9BACT|nr:MAG: hypothetical protein A2160_05930 [Candidatus Beckwithbacteria bacterium RBG_13_42_9]
MENKNKMRSLCRDFLQHLEIEKNCSPLTVRNYQHYLQRFFNWVSKHKKEEISVNKIDLKLIRNYRQYLSRLVNAQGRGLKRVTQGYHVIALRSFLKWLIKNDYHVLAPEKIDLPRFVSRSLKFLDGEQIERLLNQPTLSSPQGLRDKALLEMLFSTGLRVSELVGLNRDQVDLKRQEFGVIGKGGRARVVFLSQRAVEWIQRYLKSREDQWRPMFIRYSGKSEIDEKGEKMRLTVRSVQRLVKKYTKKAKLAVEATTHTLRHSFATDLLIHGADLRSVQELLGHKNIATTQIYTHVTNLQLKKIHQKYHSGNR